MEQNGLLYSKDHEWVRVEGNRAFIGISDYAQNSLGSIVFVELPKVGKALGQGQILGVVESVKAASDIISPISGTVLEVNKELSDRPEAINETPYDSHIAVLEVKDMAELSYLMASDAYEAYIKTI